ncbi:MAG: LysE family transporter, partial [Pseudomonadota bacterium]
MATSLALGRGDGMAFATGVCFWGLVAATGLGVLLATVGWLFGAPKIAGALHLLWLAYKSMRSAVRSESSAGIAIGRAGLWRRGVAVHLTNPKAVLGWAAVIAVGVGALAYRPPPR